MLVLPLTLSAGGSILSFEMEITGMNRSKARAEVYRIVGRENSQDRAEKHRTIAYVYTDEVGNPLYRVVRRERGTGTIRQKTFHIERYESGHWQNGLGTVRRVPYRLKKLVTTNFVLIVEGEKACETLRKRLKVFATTNPMGAGKWLPEYAQHFRGKHVTIIPDNDQPGRSHALKIAESLLSVAASISITELPNVAEKGDVTDWQRAGGTREQLRTLIENAPVLKKAGLEALRRRWSLDNSHVAPQSFPFRVSDKGVFWLEGKDGPARLAAPVVVIAQTRDAEGNNWGRLLRWPDAEGREHRWPMPMELLASDATAPRARLLADGLPYITTNARLRERFAEYLQTAPVEDRVLCIARVGWHGKAFALPDRTIAPEGTETVLFQTPFESAHHWGTKGTADEWREQVGELCCGNSRLILAVSCGFAGPLLSLIGAESGGIHFCGPTSTGKSTALIVGGSVCGGGGRTGFVQPWRTTVNGLEAIAEAHNDGTLFLDELSQVDPREAAETAYLLGNGQGKVRMTRSITVRRRLTWNLIYVSAGETTLAEHAASAGKRTRGGADVRLLNVESDAGAGMGLFEDLHGAASPGEFAHRLKGAALNFYGTVFESFLRSLVRNRKFAKSLVLQKQTTLQDCVVDNASGEVRRAAERFGLIGAAGELATRWGLTGWEENEAIRAAKRAFRQWMVSRGGAGNADADAGVRAVRAFILTHGTSRFEKIRSGHGGSGDVVRDRAGFVRLDQESGKPSEFYIFPETFRGEICKGYSHGLVLKELEARGYLHRKPPDMTVKPYFPGVGRPRVFCVLAEILEGND